MDSAHVCQGEKNLEQNKIIKYNNLIHQYFLSWGNYNTCKVSDKVSHNCTTQFTEQFFVTMSNSK